MKKAVLDASREEEVRAVRARVHAVFPELLPIIKDLRAAGFDIGWRNVTQCQTDALPEPKRSARGPFSTGREFSEG